MKQAASVSATAARIAGGRNFMRVQNLRLDQIRPDPRNARIHTPKQIQQIADSIAAFGFTVPMLVDEDNQLIAGHGRYRAARSLGLLKVPVIRITGLSAAKRRALAIADNKISGNAKWNRAQLAIEVRELTALLKVECLDISVLGFEPIEIEALQIDTQEQCTDFPEFIESEWMGIDPVSRAGDLWLLGSHELLCGGHDPVADIAQLMNGSRADLAFLNLPAPDELFNRVRAKRIQSAAVQHQAWTSLFTRVLKTAAMASREGAMHYACFKPWHCGELTAAAAATYGNMIGMSAWLNARPRPRSHASDRDPYALIGIFRVGAPDVLPGHPKASERSRVWRYAAVPGRIPAAVRSDSVVPAALMADLMQNDTREGQVVLDPFAGLGATIIAAEQLRRRARVRETAPLLVDLIIRRWQAFTGEDAVHAKNRWRFDQIAFDRPPLSSASITRHQARKHASHNSKQ